MELLLVIAAFLVPAGMYWLTYSKGERLQNAGSLIVFGYMAANIALFLAARQTRIGLAVFAVWFLSTLGFTAWAKFIREEDRRDQ